MTSPTIEPTAPGELDPRDVLLQSFVPTIVVPKFGAAPAALQGSGHRFLVAQNGVWLELVRPWVRVVTAVSSAIGVKAPIGDLAEVIEIPRKIPRSLLGQFLQQARKHCDTEQAAFITVDQDGNFALRAVDIKDHSVNHINYICPKLAPGEDVVVDMHTHAYDTAGFSPIDDRDDNEMVKISLVVGNCDQKTLSIAIRLCVLGKQIPIHDSMDIFL